MRGLFTKIFLAVAVSMLSVIAASAQPCYQPGDRALIRPIGDLNAAQQAYKKNPTAANRAAVDQAPTKVDKLECKGKGTTAACTPGDAKAAFDKLECKTH